MPYLNKICIGHELTATEDKVFIKFKLYLIYCNFSKSMHGATEILKSSHFAREIHLIFIESANKPNV